MGTVPRAFPSATGPAAPGLGLGPAVSCVSPRRAATRPPRQRKAVGLQRVARRAGGWETVSSRIRAGTAGPEQQPSHPGATGGRDAGHEGRPLPLVSGGGFTSPRQNRAEFPALALSLAGVGTAPTPGCVFCPAGTGSPCVPLASEKPALTGKRTRFQK